jgi:hypothetical protein
MNEMVSASMRHGFVKVPVWWRVASAKDDVDELFPTMCQVTFWGYDGIRNVCNEYIIEKKI